MVVYFDESGNTGPNLVERNRPYFVLGSVCFTSEELDTIWSDCDLVRLGREVHYDILKKSIKGRERLRKILNHPLLDSAHVKCEVCEKRFCVYAQMVDVLVETMCYLNGYDIGVRHEGMVLANCLYYAMFCHKNQRLVELFEDSFVSMVRNQSEDDIIKFYGVLETLIDDKNTDEKTLFILDIIRTTRNYVKDALIEDKNYLDVTLSSFCDIMYEWRKEHGAECFDVVMDDSHVMEHYRYLIEVVSNIKEKKVVGYGSRKHSYPLPVRSFETKSSDIERGLQIADVVASAFGAVLNKNDHKLERFRHEVENSNLLKLPYMGLFPQTLEQINNLKNNYEGNGDDVNPLDYLCEILDNE